MKGLRMNILSLGMLSIIVAKVNVRIEKLHKSGSVSYNKTSFRDLLVHSK